MTTQLINFLKINYAQMLLKEITAESLAVKSGSHQLIKVTKII